MATHAPTTGAPSCAPITLSTILQFCEERSIPVTRFGRLAVGDPRLVIDMQNGREPTPRVMQRVHAFIAGEVVPASKRPLSRGQADRSPINITADDIKRRNAMIEGSAKLLTAIRRARGEA